MNARTVVAAVYVIRGYGLRIDDILDNPIDLRQLGEACIALATALETDGKPPVGMEGAA